MERFGVVEVSQERLDGLETADLPPPIRVQDFRKRFGAQPVLEEVSLEVARGEMLVVLGPSGSGKTTLLRILAGLEHPDGGTLHLHGREATHLPPQRRNFGVVFQEQALFGRMTVEANIAFGLELRGVSGAPLRERVDDMLTLIRLERHRAKYPRQLSGGQRQRVAVARALAFEPEAMLFDEPFSALDALTRAELRRELRGMLRDLAMPALFITHDQEEALELADRIAILNDGRLEQVGTPFEIYNHPCNEFVATFLGSANVLLGRWRRGEVTLGARRLKPPAGAPSLTERQAVKIVFRPEDAALNFQAQLLGTPHYLGRGFVEDASYVGPTERLVVRVHFSVAASASREGFESASLEEVYAGGFPIIVTRTKWEAADMELSAGDAVEVGLKDYRLLAHYPLLSESGAKVVS